MQENANCHVIFILGYGNNYICFGDVCTSNLRLCESSNYFNSSSDLRSVLFLPDINWWVVTFVVIRFEWVFSRHCGND